VDTEQLALRLLDDGYLLAPGALFHAERRPSTLMRINFATTQEAVFWGRLSGRGRDVQVTTGSGSVLPVGRAVVEWVAASDPLLSQVEASWGAAG
jgi:hypothetical protein